MKILEWVHLFESKRINAALFKDALAQQTEELKKAKLYFQSFEVEEEDQNVWERDFEPALKGLFTAFENAIEAAYAYAKSPQKTQLKKILGYLQEVERIEQYVHTRFSSVNYLTRREIEQTLSLVSERVSTLLSME